ncbi:MAG: hypothetical protein ABL993_07405 [Vicinamibacterales bacterium]
MRVHTLWFPTLILAATLAAATCGGSSSPTTPSPSPAPAPSPAPSTNTITISASGVSPKTITVPPGTRVTFVNNSNSPHDMSSDPHPEHTDCPEINQVGFISAGQTKLTGNLNTPRTCGYHDHNQPSNTSLQGSIVIQ